MNVIYRGRSRGMTRVPSEQACILSDADLPDDVRMLARQCILCRLHAGRLAQGSRRYAGGRGARAGGRLPERSGTMRLQVLSASLVNGTASHALDFDDV